MIRADVAVSLSRSDLVQVPMVFEKCLVGGYAAQISLCFLEKLIRIGSQNC